MAKVFFVYPTIGEKIRCADGENHSLACLRCSSWNGNAPSIPPDFEVRSGSMVGARDFQLVFENAGGVIIIVPRRITIAPGRERFPAKRDDDLLTPIALLVEPFFLRASRLTVEAKL